MIGGAGAALLSGTPLLSRAGFLAGMSGILGANQRILYVPNGTDTTTSVESSTVGRTITWDADIASRVSKLGNAYVQSFNGTNQWGDAPDAADLSFGNGTVDSAFSGFALVNPTALATEQSVFTKFASGWEEYRLAVDSGGLVRVFLHDSSAGVAVEARTAANGVVAGAWRLIAFTYDGRGGATAADGISVYVNGSDRTSVRNNSASYVAMENLGAGLNVASRHVHSATFFGGGIGLVALTQKALTAADHQRVAALCARHFGLTL